MKSLNDDLSQRYLVLIKVDATNLLNRIKTRQTDYMDAFSLKRDREIFKEIFQCRYKGATAFDLSHLPLEVIEVANEFYTIVDDLYWYLMNTQDMPNAIEDECFRFIYSIEKAYASLCLYADAELSGPAEPITEPITESVTEPITEQEDPVESELVTPAKASSVDSSEFFITEDDLDSLEEN